MPAASRPRPHFHPVVGSGGLAAIEHPPHELLPDIPHVHRGQPELETSVPEERLPGFLLARRNGQPPHGH